VQQTSYLQTILNYFTSMNIDKLRFYLKEEYSYQDTTKEIFLSEIEEVFKAHKNSGDTKLLIYKGGCGSKYCGNCGVKGYRFVGNHSKNYIDLLFEMEGDDVKDICNCEEFKPYVEIDRLGIKESIYIDLDDQVTFNKTPEYWAKVYSARAAYSEIITSPPKQLDFEELSYWVDKHAVSDAAIGNYNIFKPDMKWSPFSKLYGELKEMRCYISDHLSEFIKANDSTNQIETEEKLIDWILKYEAVYFYEEESLDLKYSFRKEGENYILNEQKLILFTGDEFFQTLTFIEFYQKHYDELLNKYNTYTKEEQMEAINKPNSHLEGVDIFSLRFHLGMRKVLEEARNASKDYLQ